MALKETRHHYPGGRRGQRTGKPRRAQEIETAPDDIDTDVEERHEESCVVLDHCTRPRGLKDLTETLESVPDQEHTDRSGLFRRDHLQYIKRDDADEHHWEDQEGPGRCEGGQIVGFVEPDHEHGEAYEERESNIDPE